MPGFPAATAPVAPPPARPLIAPQRPEAPAPDSRALTRQRCLVGRGQGAGERGRVLESPGAGGAFPGLLLLSGSVGREVPGCAPLLVVPLPAVGPMLQEGRFLALITRLHGG